MSGSSTVSTSISSVSGAVAESAVILLASPILTLLENELIVLVISEPWAAWAGSVPIAVSSSLAAPLVPLLRLIASLSIVVVVDASISTVSASIFTVASECISKLVDVWNCVLPVI